MNLAGYPRKELIGNGELITLRPMIRKDKEDLETLFADLSEREKIFVRPDDIDPEMSAAGTGCPDYSRAFPVVALAGERIVGIATLHRSDLSWMRHLGNIRITVAPDYRRMGLGWVLAGELFKNSLQYGLDKIIAEIVKDQVDVSLFFNGLGFRTEASLSGHYLDDNGIKHDVLIMSNSPKQLWKYWVERKETVKQEKRVGAF